MGRAGPAAGGASRRRSWRRRRRRRSRSSPISRPSCRRRSRGPGWRRRPPRSPRRQAAEERWKRLEEGFRDEEKKQAKSDCRGRRRRPQARRGGARPGLPPVPPEDDRGGRVRPVQRQLLPGRGRADAARAKSDMMYQGQPAPGEGRGQGPAGPGPGQLRPAQGRHASRGHRDDPGQEGRVRAQDRRAGRPARRGGGQGPLARHHRRPARAQGRRPHAQPDGGPDPRAAADLWVKIFVPETEIGKVRLDQAAEVTVDSYPGRRFKGKVYYIASQSEFTPRNVQSIDERRHQVFGIKVRVDRPRRRGRPQVRHGGDGVCADDVSRR